jgi:hypothetical protein
MIFREEEISQEGEKSLITPIAKRLHRLERSAKHYTGFHGSRVRSGHWALVKIKIKMITNKKGGFTC